jgi:hypothetical protein
MKFKTNIFSLKLLPCNFNIFYTHKKNDFFFFKILFHSNKRINKKIKEKFKISKNIK